MGLSKQRKQHLSLIFARAAESHKHKKSIGKMNKNLKNFEGSESSSDEWKIED